MDPINADAAKIIRKARELIADPDDWSSLGTGSAFHPSTKGTRCPVVALAHAVNLTRSNAAVYNVAYKTVHQLLVDRGHIGTIGGWNDTPGRTHDEVIALLTEAERCLS